MATIGVATSVGSVGPGTIPDVSIGNLFMVGQTPWGVDGTYTLSASMGAFTRQHGGLNKLVAVGSPDVWTFETTDAVVQNYYAAKAYFAEKAQGSPGVLYFSRVVASSSGPVVASLTVNDVSGANPTTFTSKWKSSVGNTKTVQVINPSPRAQYSPGAGTLSVTNSSASVTGSGTNFATTDVGKGIQISGVNYVILTRVSATSITIGPNYAGTTLSGLAYSLAAPSFRVLPKFPQAGMNSEVWDILSAADALSASQRSELITITLPGGGTFPNNAAATKLTGGSDGTVAYSASAADYVGTTSAANVKSGMQVFNDQRLGLGYVVAPGQYNTTVRGGLVTHCTSYWRLCPMSSPSGLNANTAPADIAGTASNFAFYLTPQIKVDDENSDSGGLLTVANEGALCGLAARMIRDYNFGPHKSPAGKSHPFTFVRDIERQSSTVPQELYDDATSGTMADSGVNTIRLKKGFVVWGNRMLATDKRWLQFNAAQTICQVIVTGQLILENYIFEPIDDKLFASVVGDFRVFMLDLYRKGALFGDEPGQQSRKEDAFSIICDRTNNPDAVVVNNEFRVDLLFAAKPNAEKATYTVLPAAPGFAGRAAQ